jgi:Holliday junction resolvase RusA-like endonuclease
VPASRPRIPRFGKPYYLKPYAEWREAALALVAAATETLEGPLYVDTVIAIQKARTSKLAIPKGDLDNYEKAAWDLLTQKGYWKDDVQITVTATEKRFTKAGEAPGTYIRIMPALLPPYAI